MNFFKNILMAIFVPMFIGAVVFHFSAEKSSIDNWVKGVIFPTYFIVPFSLVTLLPSYYLLRYFKLNKWIVHILPFFITMLIFAVYDGWFNLKNGINYIIILFQEPIGLIIWLSFSITMLMIYFLDKKSLNQAKKKLEEV